MATTPTTTTTTPPSTPVIHGPMNIDHLNESWCELQYRSGCSSTGSISHLHHTVNPEVLEKLLQEAQKEVAQSCTAALLAETIQLQKTSSSISSSRNASSMSLSQNLLNANGNSDSTATFLLPSQQSSEINSPFTSLTPPLMVPDAIECTHCLIHKQQIEGLLEKQHEQSRIILNLQRRQEEQLTKSPKLISTPPSISSLAAVAVGGGVSPTSANYPPSPAAVAAALRRQSSSSSLVGSNTAVSGMTNSASTPIGMGSSSAEPTDWMKNWASRPQNQPPKEWIFIHPNSANSKYNTMKKLDMTENKLLTKETIGKLFITHMASFILGATLMFLILRKSLNIRSSIYFV